jgi:hypothetical protein
MNTDQREVLKGRLAFLFGGSFLLVVFTFLGSYGLHSWTLPTEPSTEGWESVVDDPLRGTRSWEWVGDGPELAEKPGDVTGEIASENATREMAVMVDSWRTTLPLILLAGFLGYCARGAERL